VTAGGPAGVHLAGRPGRAGRPTAATSMRI
jgi:hypothetical protein